MSVLKEKQDKLGAVEAKVCHNFNYFGQYVDAIVVLIYFAKKSHVNTLLYVDYQFLNLLKTNRMDFLFPNILNSFP